MKRVRGHVTGLGTRTVRVTLTTLSLYGEDRRLTPLCPTPPGDATCCSQKLEP